MTLLFLCINVLYACGLVHVYVRAETCMLTCIWKPDVKVRCLPLSLSI